MQVWSRIMPNVQYFECHKPARVWDFLLTIPNPEDKTLKKLKTVKPLKTVKAVKAVNGSMGPRKHR